MKPQEEIVTYESQTLDGRDISRLADFMTKEQVIAHPTLNLRDENAEWHQVEYTRENIIGRLKSDLAFAFEKALDKRGISAGCMFYVIKMWMWVLHEHEDLINWPGDKYAQYGLPLLKAVALRYDLPNEIGEDNGDEFSYSSEADE